MDPRTQHRPEPPRAPRGAPGPGAHDRAARDAGVRAVLLGSSAPERWPALDGEAVCLTASAHLTPAELERRLSACRSVHVLSRWVYRSDLFRLARLLSTELDRHVPVEISIEDERLVAPLLRFIDERSAYMALLSSLAEGLIAAERLLGEHPGPVHLTVDSTGARAAGSVAGRPFTVTWRPGDTDRLEVRASGAGIALRATLDDEGLAGRLRQGSRSRALRLPGTPDPLVRFYRAVASDVVDPLHHPIDGARWIDALRHMESALNEVDLEQSADRGAGPPNPLGLGWVRRSPPLLLLTEERFREGLQLRLDGVRVALVRAPNRDPDRSPTRLVPFSTPALAAFLARQGAEVVQVDLNAEPDVCAVTDPAALAARALERAGSGYDLVGLSVDRTQDLAEARGLVPALRAVLGAPVALGGRGVHGTQQQLVEAAEHVVSGDGELPLLLLLAHLRGHDVALHTIPGLTHRDAEGRPQTSLPVEHALPVLPRPAYGGLLDAYRRAFPETDVWVPYSWEVGCAFSCAYCSNYTERRVRFRELSDVIDDLQVLRDELGVSHVAFFNNMLNLRPQLALALYGEMRERRLGLTWGDSARPSKLDPGVFAELRRSGCAYLVWGVDAGSEKLQLLMKKKLRFDVVEELLRKSHAQGIENRINLIAGLPHEDEEDLRDVLDLLDRLHPYITTVYLSRYEYSPSSPVYRWPARYGLIKRGDTFDEVGGLCWDDKQRQIDRHHGIVTARLRELGLA